MKKLILLIMFFILPLNIFAEEKTLFSLNEVTASPGSNITIKLNVKNNPKFGILTAKLHYDMEKLEYVSSEIKGMKKAVLKGSESNDKGIVAFYAITLDSSDLFDDTDTLLIVDFKIKETTEEDSEIRLEITDFGKDENTPIVFDSVNGKVKINKKVESTTIDENISLDKEIKEEKEVVWETSDENIASVDEDGNVEFKQEGNVTITAKEKNNEDILYEKDYYVNDKLNKNNNKFLSLIFSSVFVLIGIIIFLILRKRK